MKLSMIISAALFVAGVLMISPNVVYAVPVLCSTGPGIDLITVGCIANKNDMLGGADLSPSNPGGLDNETNVEGAILASTGVSVNISSIGRTDNSGTLADFVFSPSDVTTSNTGTWMTTLGEIVSYITIKASKSFVLFEFDPATSSGSYSTEGIAGRLFSSGKAPKYVSHISFWTTNGVTVPEPATLALLGVGLVGVGLVRRKRST